MKKHTKMILSFLIGSVVGAMGATYCVGNLIHNTVQRTQKLSDKHLELYKLLLNWMHKLHEGKKVAGYLKEKGYTEIAIYGFSDVGQLLAEELGKEGIKIAFGIDQNAESINADIKIISCNDTIPSVDAVLVTPITYYEDIKNNLEKKLECPIISLKMLLDEMQ